MSKVIYKNREEMLKWVGANIKDGSADIQHDNKGQVIVYSGVYEWKDGTFRFEPDPSWEDDS